MATISNTGPDTYRSDLEAAFETLQEQRASLLDLARGLQLSGRVLALQEARRLSASVGPDDPRVAAYVASSDAMLQRVAALEVETQIARIRVPVVSRTETLLQGRVTDADAQALPHLTVTLVDASGAPVAGIDPAATDDSGYFAFVLEPAQLDAIGATRPLTLQVGSDAGRIAPASVKPFTLAAGQVTALDVPLQAGEMDKLGLRSVFTAAPPPVKVGGTVGNVPVRKPVPVGKPAPAPDPAPAHRKSTAATKAKTAPRAKAAPGKKR